MDGVSVGRKPWETLAVDTLSSFPRSSNGYRLILVAVDVASRWLELLPLRSTDPLEVAFVIEQNIFLTFGPPSFVIIPPEKAEFQGLFPKILTKYNVTKLGRDDVSSRILAATDRCRKVAKKLLQQKMSEYHTVPWDHLLKHVAYSFRTLRVPSMKFTPQKTLLPFLREKGEGEGYSSEKTRAMSTESETNSDTTGSGRDSLAVLKEERCWFETNMDRFHGLSLSMKAEALRSKILSNPDVCESLQRRGSATKTAMKIRGSHTARV